MQVTGSGQALQIFHQMQNNMSGQHALPPTRHHSGCLLWFLKLTAHAMYSKLPTNPQQRPCTKLGGQHRSQRSVRRKERTP